MPDNPPDMSLSAVRRRTTRAALRAAGITQIVATYEGGHDSGYLTFDRETATTLATVAAVSFVASVRTYDYATKTHVTGPRLFEMRAESAADEVLTDALTARLGNWWDGDVEYSGTITWNVAADIIRSEGSHCVKDYACDDFDESDDMEPPTDGE
jgi:hypothetical protein